MEYRPSMSRTGGFYMNGKRMIITGASKGIGRGLAAYFAGLGARIAAVARSRDALISLQKEITSQGGECRIYPTDLRDISNIRPVFDTIADDFGGLDILVNNAGMGKPIPAMDIQESDWDEMMSLNLKAAFFCAQAAARHMLSAGSGRIVNISSQAAVVAIDGETIYCASKGGINQMTKVLALEWSKTRRDGERRRSDFHPYPRNRGASERSRVSFRCPGQYTQRTDRHH
jgi:NAD(P)-dependent dehydrogenase (short-subunit alcohol dehydrogenase family)